MNDLRFACIVCGQQLRETHGKVLSCTFCLESEHSDYTCENRHYVCETCRVGTPAELIVRTCKASSTKDSFSLANLLMSHPAIGMAGPEHHLLVPAVLLSVAKNAGYEIPLESKLHTAMKRAGRFGLGSCASMGACGAAMGVAIATSLLTEADYTKPAERKSVLTAAASALTALSDLPGGRCCKAAVYASLSAGVDHLRRELGLEFAFQSVPICQFHKLNDECVGPDCPFFDSDSRDQSGW